MVQIRWTERAIKDADSIKNYISENSILYARITIDKIKKRVKILKSNPKSGRVVPEFEIEILRELIEGNFRIVYRIVNILQIDIISIFHTSRDMSKLIIE